MFRVWHLVVAAVVLAGAVAVSAERREATREAAPSEFEVLRQQAKRVVEVLFQEGVELDEWLVYASDSPFKVRRQALNQIQEEGRLSDAEKQQIFLYFLKSDPEANMRSHSASMLSPGGQERVAALIAATEDRDRMVRVIACQSLGAAKPVPGVDLDAVKAALMRRVDDEDLWVARVAVGALGALNHRPAVQKIIRFFRKHHTDASVAWSCAGALAALGEREVLFDAANVALGSDNWNIRFFTISHLNGVVSPRVVPLFVKHLAGELELAVAEIKRHNMYPRPFLAMIVQLEDRTGKRLGLDVNGWVAWLGANRRKYSVPARVRFPRAKAALQREFVKLWGPSWLRKFAEWKDAVATILKQDGYTIRRYHEFQAAISVVDRRSSLVPPAQRDELERCIAVLKDLLKHRGEWKVHAAYPTSIGPPDRLLEQSIRDAVVRFERERAPD